MKSVILLTNKKSVMKNLKIFAVVLFVMGMIASSCEGPEGPRGPAGAAGTDGTDGNANVIVYSFGDTTFTSTANFIQYHLVGMTEGQMDSSVVLPYFSNTGNVWYLAGGYGSGGAYITRFFIWPDATPPTVNIQMLNTDGSDYSGSDETWDSVRIFIIPATDFRMAEENGLNWKNFSEVNSFYNQK